MMETMKKNSMNTMFVEVEIVIDIKYVDMNVGSYKIIDSGAPMFIISYSFFREIFGGSKG